ncbi:mitochondrion protein [Ceraceosorus bombacis]|uniref:Mitochondrion protein n=1 Tax=Ceraceosorus bombacis TaxID=401625 RepID=A0A0P1BAW1_9BASI|nr:mitochondrion protein [Ceraceosorus bombacis]
MFAGHSASRRLAKACTRHPFVTKQKRHMHVSSCASAPRSPIRSPAARASVSTKRLDEARSTVDRSDIGPRRPLCTSTSWLQRAESAQKPADRQNVKRKDEAKQEQDTGSQTQTQGEAESSTSSGVRITDRRDPSMASYRESGKSSAAEAAGSESGQAPQSSNVSAGNAQSSSAGPAPMSTPAPDSLLSTEELLKRRMRMAQERLERHPASSPAPAPTTSSTAAQTSPSAAQASPSISAVPPQQSQSQGSKEAFSSIPAVDGVMLNRTDHSSSRGAESSSFKAGESVGSPFSSALSDVAKSSGLKAGSRSDAGSTKTQGEGANEDTVAGLGMGVGMSSGGSRIFRTGGASGTSRDGQSSGTSLGKSAAAGQAGQSINEKGSELNSSRANDEERPVALDPHEPRTLVHPFDSHAFVQRLMSAGWVKRRSSMSDPHPASDSLDHASSAQGLEQALSEGERQQLPSNEVQRPHDPAEAIMEATRFLLSSRSEVVLRRNLNKTMVENEAYLFNAALAELRTELQVRARSDAAALRSITTLLQREVDGLSQRMTEEINTLKHDIAVDMNNRKSESQQDTNALEQEIQDLQNRFTISLGDLRVEIEESIRWGATRRALGLAFGIALIVISTIFLADYFAPVNSESDENAYEARSSSSSGEQGIES